VKLIPLNLTGFKFIKVSLGKIKKYAKEFGALVVPRTLSVINIQIFIFVINYFASFLEPGKLGIFNLASSFQELPQTIFATSIAMAAFPTLSKLFHQSNIEGVKKLYLKSFHQINFIIFLISSWLFVLRYPLVKILLNYGNFDLGAIKITADVLQIMALGLSFSALLLLNLDTLFTLGDMLTPLLASFFAYGLGSVLI
jgi:putative peptidoglycan lipid II flippase